MAKIQLPALDARTQTYMDIIFDMPVESLNESNKRFIRARADYLTKEQREKFKSVLKESSVPEQKDKEVPAPQAPFVEPSVTDTSEVNGQQVSYNDLLKRARDLGYKGPRTKRDELVQFIQDKT